MALAILTLITALSISAVAIYYSVAGLMTIFAAAAIPIMIMGGTLEVGKLVTAVWLHKHWHQATWWLKTYLSVAVLVLMFITSMGIFGFLSKAHIEQTASANEGIALMERIDDEIARNEQIIARAESKIQELESEGTGASNQIQRQIDREQSRIESAYSRIQPAIDEQNQIIQNVSALFQQELDRVDAELARLQGFIDRDEIEKAQAMVGTAVDGDYGPNTARAFTEFQDAKRAERAVWLQRIQESAQSPVVVEARAEIARLRASAEEQIAESNALINNLRNQLKSNESNNLQTMLDEQNERVRTASLEVEQLFEQRFELEAEYRKLEAEVGPVKYIAEFIYGEEADKNLLEEAVRWVIIVIIFVFDPLAVLLLIAAQYTFEFNRKRKDDNGGCLRQYEQSRAQRIVDNPGYHSNTDHTPPEEEKVDDDLVPGEFGAEDNGRNTTDGMALAEQGEVNDSDTILEETNTLADATVRDVDADNSASDTDVAETAVEQDQVQPDDGLTTEEVAAAYTPVEKKESDIKSSEESSQERERRQAYEAKEQDEDFTVGKHAWKEANPDKTLKHYKNLYIKGVIDQLPWETPVEDDNYKEEGYRQNGEQNEDTLFNKLQNR